VVIAQEAAEMASANEWKKSLSEFGWRGSREGLDAAALQKSVIDGDAEQIGMGIDYTDQHVRLAQVHARQDLVLVVSSLESANGHLRRIATLLQRLFWLVLLLGVIGILYFAWR
jgi:hypothetical protein